MTTTKYSDAILSAVNRERERASRPLTLGGGWELGDLQRVVIEMLRQGDERGAAGRGEPQLLRCEHGVPVNEACAVCGDNSVQRTSAYGVAIGAPSPEPAPGSREDEWVSADDFRMPPFDSRERPAAVSEAETTGEAGAQPFDVIRYNLREGNGTYGRAPWVVALDQVEQQHKAALSKADKLSQLLEQERAHSAALRARLLEMQNAALEISERFGAAQVDREALEKAARKAVEWFVLDSSAGMADEAMRPLIDLVGCPVAPQGEPAVYTTDASDKRYTSEPANPALEKTKSLGASAFDLLHRALWQAVANKVVERDARDALIALEALRPTTEDSEIIPGFDGCEHGNPSGHPFCDKHGDAPSEPANPATPVPPGTTLTVGARVYRKRRHGTVIRIEAGAVGIVVEWDGGSSSRYSADELELFPTRH